ncbi:MAG TPA: 50S ribosomal protein L6, partial [Planctomycetota bacterium]|nr:50S ribosomal protein L6 [Planctomycetota bacterium]
MSRLGRRPVAIPDGVTISLASGSLSVKGPGGELTQKILDGLDVKVDSAAKKLLIERRAQSTQARCNHGTLRVLVQNMFTGVTKGFEKGLRI